MTEAVFADTNYWVAKIFPHDQWHRRVIQAEFELGLVSLVTSESVLVETLNYFSEFRADVKETADLVVKSIVESDDVNVVRQTEKSFNGGVEFYGRRLDQGYSLTDCISMKICLESEITRVLTHDRHFEQEGFEILL